MLSKYRSTYFHKQSIHICLPCSIC